MILQSHSSENSPSNLDRFPDTDPGSSEQESDTKALFKENSGALEVEGKKLLERFGANISVSRKGKLPSQALTKATPDTSGDGNGNGKKETDVSHASISIKKENILERLSGIGGISISTKSKSSTNGNSESKLSPGISISSKQKSIDLNQLKKLKDQDSENEKKIFNRNKLLEKLSGSGLISIAPKIAVKTEAEEADDKELISEGKTREDTKTEVGEVLERLGSKVALKGIRSKSEESNESSELKKSGDNQTCQVKFSEDDRGKVLNENSSENSEQKRFIRVKNSTFSKRNIRLEKQNSLDEPFAEERTGTPEESKERESVPKETGIDILERLTENLNNTVGGKKSGKNCICSTK